MSLPTPLRALCASDPAAARRRIWDALTASDGHRARAAAHLARPRVEGREPWLPRRGAYGALWRCIVALDMGEEVRRRWPAPSDPRGAPAAKPVEEESLGSYYMLGRGGSGPAPEKVRRTR